MLQPQQTMYPQQQQDDQMQLDQSTEPLPIYLQDSLDQQQYQQQQRHLSETIPPPSIQQQYQTRHSFSSQNLRTYNQQRPTQQQRYHFLQQQQLSNQQQQQQQRSSNNNQLFSNPMMPSLNSWNRKNSISQPSDPALQRLGLNNKYSNHQLLPSMTNLHSSSPVSPNGITFSDKFNDPTSPHSNPPSSLTNNPISLSSMENNTTSNNSINNSQLNKSPQKTLFKNVWGFDNSNTTISPSPPIIEQQTSNYKQSRIHSISELPNNSNYFVNNSNKNQFQSSIRQPPNLNFSSINSNELISSPISPNDSKFNPRSKSIAVSNTKSKYNNNLPITHEYSQTNYDNNSNHNNYIDHNSTHGLPQQRRTSMLPPSTNKNYNTFSGNGYQFNNNSNNHIINNTIVNSNINNHPNSNRILESQQQQVIPPLRAGGPVLSGNNVNYQPPRRESVAALYSNHHNNYDNNINNNNSNNNQHASYYPQTNFINNNNINNNNQLIYSQQNSNYNNDIIMTNDDKNNYNYSIEDNEINSPNIIIPKFTKVKSSKDLKPIKNDKQKFRRASSTNTFISPLTALTTKLNVSYSMCVPEYDYQISKNPRRVLTKNNKPCHNNGYDNENFDYILYVNDILGTEENKKYLVLDILGQGTFGQVVKCQNLKTQEIVAVKVVKARQECLQQSIAEGNVIEFLNKKIEPRFKKYFINLKDKFMHKYHLCLVFELLSSNLYELIKQNHHHGLCIKLIRNFSRQILESLCALKDIKIIHCDLKPENILLSKLNKPDLKIIDFGSACEEHQILYSYVQSRFYRSPEVILGAGYSTSVDMWSFGCIVAELFLGLPLLPGASEFEQLVRMVQIFGMPPSWMMVEQKASNYIIKQEIDNNNNNNNNKIKYNYRLKTLDEFNRDFGLHEEPPKQYFVDTNLKDIILNYRLPSKEMSEEMIVKEMHDRSCLVHFLKGCLNISPLERWTPQEAIQHPFITGESWTGDWVPPAAEFSSVSKRDYRSNSYV